MQKAERPEANKIGNLAFVEQQAFRNLKHVVLQIVAIRNGQNETFAFCGGEGERKGKIGFRVANCWAQ